MENFIFCAVFVSPFCKLSKERLVSCKQLVLEIFRAITPSINISFTRVALPLAQEAAKAISSLKKYVIQ